MNCIVLICTAISFSFHVVTISNYPSNKRFIIIFSIQIHLFRCKNILINFLALECFWPASKTTFKVKYFEILDFFYKWLDNKKLLEIRKSKIQNDFSKFLILQS